MKSKFCTYLTCAYAYNVHPFCPLSNHSISPPGSVLEANYILNLFAALFQKFWLFFSLVFILYGLLLIFFLPIFLNFYMPSLVRQYCSIITKIFRLRIFNYSSLNFMRYMVSLNLVNGRFPYVYAENKPRS